MTKKRKANSSNYSFRRGIISSLGQHPNVTFYFSILLLTIITPCMLWLILKPITSSNSGAIWVGFWGSFLGAIIGAIITYVVMMRTFTENNKNNVTERESSFKLHRAETLRNDYREQSGCINHFVDVLQAIISDFNIAMFQGINVFDKPDQIIKRNVIEIKSKLKNAQDKIFDIPISDIPAKIYLEKIKKLYSIVISSIDNYTASFSTTYDYINRMQEEDSVADVDNRYIQTSVGLTSFDKTILVDAFNLVLDRYTENFYSNDSSGFIAGWERFRLNSSEISYKRINGMDGLFMVTSPILVHAFFSTKDDSSLKDAYRRIIIELIKQIDKYNDVDANIKNFEASIKKYIEEISFDNLMVVPIVIIRHNIYSTYNELDGEEEIIPVVLTDKCRKMIKERFFDSNNYIWNFDEQDSMPGCKYEIDNELCEEIFGYKKNDYIQEDRDNIIDCDNSQSKKYLDFVFMDLTHPELNILLLYPVCSAKLLKVPSLIEDIHRRFRFAVKEELLSLTSLKNP